MELVFNSIGRFLRNQLKIKIVPFILHSNCIQAFILFFCKATIYSALLRYHSTSHTQSKGMVYLGFVSYSGELDMICFFSVFKNGPIPASSSLIFK